MLIRITVTLASQGRLASPKKSMASEIHPMSSRKPLIMPFLANILETYSREINWGMAMVSTRIVRHPFLNLMPFLLIAMATNMPRK